MKFEDRYETAMMMTTLMAVYGLDKATEDPNLPDPLKEKIREFLATRTRSSPRLFTIIRDIGQEVTPLVRHTKAASAISFLWRDELKSAHLRGTPSTEPIAADPLDSYYQTRVQAITMSQDQVIRILDNLRELLSGQQQMTQRQQVMLQALTPASADGKRAWGQIPKQEGEPSTPDKVEVESTPPDKVEESSAPDKVDPPPPKKPKARKRKRSDKYEIDPVEKPKPEDLNKQVLLELSKKALDDLGWLDGKGPLPWAVREFLLYLKEYKGWSLDTLSRSFFEFSGIPAFAGGRWSNWLRGRNGPSTKHSKLGQSETREKLHQWILSFQKEFQG